ncbi:MAG: 16S rRNA (guanine(527)-N(7))-methyltransferase RsmG [Bradymonadales bacterium]|nr:16S rRNA (guanine(527)-N(7))-methyltransferase RsmG [Bradymonadales bacterium]
MTKRHDHDEASPGRLRRQIHLLSCDLDPAEDRLTALEAYSQLVQTYGSRVNLVGDASPPFVDTKLILGSLQILRLKVPSGHLLDVGSGAGFPGIPLAILLPDLQVTLVEPRRKRVAFLRHVVARLELSQVGVVDRPIQRYDGPLCDWAISRAFLPLEKWLALAPSLVVREGYVGAYSTVSDWSQVRIPPALRLLSTARDETQANRMVALLQTP